MDAPIYPTPIDPEVARAVSLLDSDLREIFEERAGILEFEAGLPRVEAECRALELTLALASKPPKSSKPSPA